MKHGLRKFSARRWDNHPLDIAFHFIHNVFHTPFHSLIGMAMVLFVAGSVASVAFWSTTDTMEYIDNITSSFEAKVAHADLISKINAQKQSLNANCAGKSTQACRQTCIDSGFCSDKPGKAPDACPKANGWGWNGETGTAYCYGQIEQGSYNPVENRPVAAGDCCTIGLYMGGVYGSPVSNGKPGCVGDNSFTWLRIPGLERGHRMSQVGTFIDQDTGCFTRFMFDASGIGHPRLVCQPRGGGAAVVIPAGTQGTNVVPLTSDPLGHIEVANTTKIEGWVIDPKAITTSIKVKLYIKNTSSNSSATAITYIDEYPANIYRPDLAAKLGLPNVEGGLNHGFNIQTPTTAKNGDTILIYAVNTNGWNPSIGEKVIGSADSPTEAISLFTANTSNNSGGLAAGGQQGGTGTNNNTNSANTSTSGPPTSCAGKDITNCFLNPKDGGPGCLESDPECQQRVATCEDGTRRGALYGYCDPAKYAACRSAGGDFTVEGTPGGRVDVEACNNFLEQKCGINPYDRSYTDATSCNPCQALNISDSECTRIYVDYWPPSAESSRSVNPNRDSISRPGKCEYDDLT